MHNCHDAEWREDVGRAMEEERGGLGQVNLKIGHRPLFKPRCFTSLYRKRNNPRTNLDHPNILMAMIKTSKHKKNLRHKHKTL